MDADFLKRLQAAGWHVESVTDEKVVARCRSPGCQLRMKMTERSPLFQSHAPGYGLDYEVNEYEQVRELLRQRREQLGLTIADVEEICGLADGHLAKAEKDGPTRIPRFDVLATWAAGLGFSFVLRPIPLTPYANRIICESRDKLAARTQRFSVEQRRRGGET